MLNNIPEDPNPANFPLYMLKKGKSEGKKTDPETLTEERETNEFSKMHPKRKKKVLTITYC